MPSPPSLLEILPGPWVEEPSGLPPGGPRSWWRGPAGVVIGGPPARVAAERAGWARVDGHPATPALLAAAEDALALPPLGPAPEDPAAVVAGWPRGEAWRGERTGAAALAEVPSRTAPARGLARVGIERRSIDRFLSSTLIFATHLGPSLGGIDGGWLRVCGERVVALRGAGASARGWSAVDLAATAAGLALAGEAEAVEDLRQAHREGLEPEEADRAFHLALLVRALDEASLGSGEAAEEAADLARAAFHALAPRSRPEVVTARIEGAPGWLDTRPWLAEPGPVPVDRARWLLQNVDGLVVAGQTLSVVLRPPVRAGRRPPPREDRALRRKRLFSRWDLGVQADDEGLYSATPEALADRLVAGLSGVVMDGTAGLGSLSLAAARNRRVTQVLAVDTHAGRLDMARHNAALYGVIDRVRFLHLDVVEALRRHPCDALILDPPWGGRGYDRERVGMEDLGLDLRQALEHAPHRVVLKLPRSFDPSSLEAIPGPWRWRGLIDDRGQLKLLAAERG